MYRELQFLSQELIQVDPEVDVFLAKYTALVGQDLRNLGGSHGQGLVTLPLAESRPHRAADVGVDEFLDRLALRVTGSEEILHNLGERFLKFPW